MGTEAGASAQLCSQAGAWEQGEILKQPFFQVIWLFSSSFPIHHSPFTIHHSMFDVRCSFFPLDRG
ncbi:MAG: hypothetical protein SWC40_00460, partial [Thermodesulfobacteriota bacterium]|nr:hypothetical protein [Thermodesulfobacteriota bacterium]